MRPKLSRLATGDYLIGGGGIALLVVLFGVRWYEVPPRFQSSLLTLGEPISASGWNTFTWLALLCLVVAVLALIAAGLQLTRDSPALPAVSLLALAPLSLLLLVWLLVRVFIDVPGVELPGASSSTLEVCAGAYVAVGLAVVIVLGVWFSLRRDSVDGGDSPTLIETLPLSQSRSDDRP